MGWLSARREMRRTRRNRKTRYRAPCFNNRAHSKNKGWLAPSVEKFFNRLKAQYPNIEAKNTYGYLTKTTRIRYGLAKTKTTDAFCIAGNLEAKRQGDYFFQKQTRKHNRQIHKMTILKGGVRKRQQAPYEVKGFRLFDKVCLKGQDGFIFGRRSSGSFDVRTLEGTRLTTGVSCKKLRLLERRQAFLTQITKEDAIPHAVEVACFLA